MGTVPKGRNWCPRKSLLGSAGEFKLTALSRTDAGDNVSALSRELNVRRKLLYAWRDAFRAGGEMALRGPGRPPKGSEIVGAKNGGVGLRAARPPGDPRDAMVQWRTVAAAA